MEEEICEFEYEGRKCDCKEVVGIARCKLLCLSHYKEIVKDNIRRFNKGQDIPKDLSFIKKPDYIWSRSNGEFKEKNNEKEVKNGNSSRNN